MEEINYEKLLPALPVEDVVSFAYENGMFKKNYLIYKSGRVFNPSEDRMKDAVLVTCSNCLQQFYAGKVKAGDCSRSMSPAPFGWTNRLTQKDVISGNDTVCPCCEAEAKTVHIGDMRLYDGELVDDAWVSVLTRIPVEGKQDRLVLLDWCIRRCIDKQGQTRHEIWPYTAWVVEEKRIVRLMGYQKNIGGAISLFGEWRQRKTFCDSYGNTNLVMPWDKRLLEGTTAENSKLDLYLKGKGAYPVSYLALWRKRPTVENLLMQGCIRLIDTWINQEKQTYPYRDGIPKLEEVNWKEKRPAQMLGLTKEEFRQMKRGKWDADMLEVYKRVRGAGIQVHLPEDTELLKVVPSYAYLRLLADTPREDFWRILRYLKKQKADWNTLQDYWKMAREDGRDLADGLVRFPRDLKASHQRQIDERNERWRRQREQERAERAEQFKKRFAELELRILQKHERNVALGLAIEYGRRLEEAKAMVGHGNWGGWLKKMGYSQSNANNLMRVFREYGTSQQSLFGGEANSQALGNLSLTKAIQLLALPDQEAREDFVETHDVENMSTRELEKALKERAEALEAAEAARAEARTAEEARSKMEADMKAVNASLKDQKSSVKKLKKETDQLQAELNELRSRPVDVAVETREPTAEELEKLTAQAVEEARAADREEIAKMKKQLASADGDIAAFMVFFNAWQKDFDSMMDYLPRISEKDPGKNGQIRKAIAAALEGMAAR